MWPILHLLELDTMQALDKNGKLGTGSVTNKGWQDANSKICFKPVKTTCPKTVRMYILHFCWFHSI